MARRSISPGETDQSRGRTAPPRGRPTTRYEDRAPVARNRLISPKPALHSPPCTPATLAGGMFDPAGIFFHFLQCLRVRNAPSTVLDVALARTRPYIDFANKRPPDASAPAEKEHEDERSNHDVGSRHTRGGRAAQPGGKRTIAGRIARSADLCR